jgi:hypothetical protein
MLSAVPRGSPGIGEAEAVISRQNYTRLMQSLRLPDRLPPLTRFEKPSPGEASAILQMSKLAACTVVENYCDAARRDGWIPAMRDQHAKPHGCLHGSFVVQPNVPPELAIGVFQPGARYEAIVRFSNAQETRKNDRFPDGRGVAIKLLEVPGEGLLPSSNADRANTTEQDFLLTNFPVFFGKNVPDYTEFLSLIASPHETWAARTRWALRILGFFAVRPTQFWIFVRNALQWVSSPLRITYHSMTPYRFGADRVVRYVLVPVQVPDADRKGDRSSSGDFLRDVLRAELRPRASPNVNGAVFDFAVQFREHVTPDDVEDASRRWRAFGDRRITLARLNIPLQNFDTAERWDAAERASFSPWHALPDHRPLGGLNRMRLAVYQASRETRHRMNMVPP